MTIRELLRRHAQVVALRVAADLNCGAADSFRVLELAEREHERFVGALSAKSRAALEQEIAE